MLGLDRPDGGTRPRRRAGRYAELRRPLHEVGALLDVAGAASRAGATSDHLLWLAALERAPARAASTRCWSWSGCPKSRAAGPAASRSACASGSGIAAALLGDPPILVLDEPANGLDPDGIVWLRGFLRSLAAEGRAVLVSSHLMGELEDTADRLVVIGRGRPHRRDGRRGALGGGRREAACGCERRAGPR